MSLQAINFAMTQPVEETGPRLLLFIIAHHVNWETGFMYVTQEQLADEIKSSERSVRRWLEYLEVEGYIARRECRGDQGRRLPDEIELIGYLEWQRVLYEGGTIKSPKARAKRVDKLSEEQPDNLAGSDDDNRTLLSGTNRTNEATQPDKSGGPTGQLCPVHKQPSSTISTTISARAGACEAGASPTRAEGSRAPLILRRGDKGWTTWLEHLPAHIAEQAEEAGAIEVPFRFPGKDSKLIALVRTNGVSEQPVGTAAAKPPAGGRVQPSLSVCRGDASWADWMAEIGPEKAAKAEIAGEIAVTARWPKRDGARFIGVVAPGGGA